MNKPINACGVRIFFLESYGKRDVAKNVDMAHLKWRGDYFFKMKTSTHDIVGNARGDQKLQWFYLAWYKCNAMSWGLKGMHAINVNLGPVFYTRKKRKSRSPTRCMIFGLIRNYLLILWMFCFSIINSIFKCILKFKNNTVTCSPNGKINLNIFHKINLSIRKEFPVF